MFEAEIEALATKSVKERRKLAEGTTTTPEVLVALAEDEDGWVRAEVAWNPNAPAATLAKLAEDKDAQVRYWMAKNPNTPAPEMKEIA